MVLTYGMDEEVSRLGGIDVSEKDEKYGIGGIKIEDDAPVGGIERSESYSLGGIEVPYDAGTRYEIATEREGYLEMDIEEIWDEEDDHWFPL